ncbi:Ig domain-containing protein, partial [Brucella intermedia]
MIKAFTLRTISFVLLLVMTMLLFMQPAAWAARGMVGTHDISGPLIVGSDVRLNIVVKCEGCKPNWREVTGGYRWWRVGLSGQGLQGRQIDDERRFSWSGRLGVPASYNESYLIRYCLPVEVLNGGENDCYDVPMAGLVRPTVTVGITDRIGSVLHGPSPYGSWVYATARASGGFDADGQPETRYTYSIANGRLPKGVTFNTESGVMEGRAGESGDFSFDVVATDRLGYVGKTHVSFSIEPSKIKLAVKGGSLPHPELLIPYEAELYATRGVEPFTFSVESGQLPPGVELNGVTGKLSGKPKVRGNYSFTLAVKDRFGASDTLAVSWGLDKPFQWEVDCPGGAELKVGSRVFCRIGVKNYVTGQMPFTMTWSGVPDGLRSSAASEGYPYINILGEPTKAGTYDIRVQARDTTGGTGEIVQRVTVHSKADIWVTIKGGGSDVPPGKVGQEYKVTFEASRGTAPYQFSVEGPLPEGLSLDPVSGELKGIPTQTGTFDFVIRATDKTGDNNFRGNHLVISAPEITISPETLSNGKVGLDYSQTISASGGVAPYSFRHGINTSPPPGLSINEATGVLSGKPTTAGTFTFWLGATDSYNQGANSDETNGWRFYTVEIAPAPEIKLSVESATGTLPVPVYNQAYSAKYKVEGGTGPYKWSVASGELPAGLSLNDDTGELTGTVKASGKFSFTIQVTDAEGYTKTRDESFTIAAPTITISPETLSKGKVGLDYSQTISASGGVGPYKYRKGINTSPPAGLSINETTGELSGKPTTAGTFTFWLGASDVNNQGANIDENNGWRFYTVEIAPAPEITLDLSQLVDGKQNLAYGPVEVKADKGTEPYEYKIEGLPEGLKAEGNKISGTPTKAGSATVTVTVTDKEGYQKSEQKTISVKAAPDIWVMIREKSELVTAVYGQAIEARTFYAENGTEPYTFSLEGSVPPGLTLDSASGVLSGTPTQTGTFNFDVRATDKDSYSNTHSNSVTVSADIKVTVDSAGGQLPVPVYN